MDRVEVALVVGFGAGLGVALEFQHGVLLAFRHQRLALGIAARANQQIHGESGEEHDTRDNAGQPAASEQQRKLLTRTAAGS